jgi:Domain of unknown function (DUF6766)
MRGWLRFNALSLVVLGAFGLVLQELFGWHPYNEELADYGRPTLDLWSYVGSGHFVEATFENWESEFLRWARRSC